VNVLAQWQSARSQSDQSDQWQRAAPVPLALRAAWATALPAAPGTVLRLFGGPTWAPRRDG
jgi:hypothetical protein